MHKLLALVALTACSARSSSTDDPAGSGSQDVIDPSVPRPVEDMVEIPAGYYLWDTRMCNERADYERSARPFAIDRRDVTCDDYGACARAGACPAFTLRCMGTRPHVSYAAATKYCAWRGAELPSTGQWQKAARKDDRFTPGGYVPDDDTKCDVSRTGPDGNKCVYTSPYGMVIEMMPAFGQWTRDKTCPRDEDRPEMHLVAWLNDRLDVLVATKDKDYGHFRCARIHP
jgi:hypothetical protein